MSAWITDRVPTSGDANKYGYVIACVCGATIGMHCDYVLLGTPWMPYPEPYVKPKRWSWHFDRSASWLDERIPTGIHTMRMPNLGKEKLDAIIDALNRLEEGV